MNDDTLMCERHEVNYIQSEGYQNRNSHYSYSHQSHHDHNDYEKSLTGLNNDVRNDLEDFKRFMCSMRTVHYKLYERDDGKTTGDLPKKKSKTVNQEPQSKTDFEKLITKFLDGQRVTNMFVKNNINDMILKMKQNKKNFQTKVKNMERKLDEWEKSQDVSSEQTDRTDPPPPPQAHAEQVNVIFTRSGKFLSPVSLSLEIVSDRRWREVMAVFKFGPTITNASFVLRKAYLSLLYHFEQVYFFRKKSPTLSADSANRLSHGPVSGSVKNLLSARQKVEVGGQVTGTIDNRFEQGYLVTVDLGNEKLSGFIYHLPSDASAPSHGTENMNQLALREPSPPEQDSSGYNVFYSEHYGRLKPLYHGQEDVIRKRIQVLWETLTQEEQQ
ncbi:ARID DNA-binding domain, high mobility group box domain protein, partial [Tanacetum coccineum]